MHLPQGTLLPEEHAIDTFTPEQLAALIARIEQRALVVLKLTTFAVRVLLTGDSQHAPDLAEDEMFLRAYVRKMLAKGNVTRPQPPAAPVKFNLTGQHLEFCAPQWAYLVPSSLPVRAALLYALGKRYGLHWQNMPQLRAVFGDDALSAPFAERYGMPPSALLISDITQQSALSEAAATMIEVIRGGLEWRALTSGEFLFKRGDKADGLYIVASGQLRILQQEGGEAHVLGHVGQGQLLGEMAVLTEEPRTADAVAIRDTVVLRLSADVFNNLTKAFPHLMMHVVRLVVERLRGAPKQRVTPLHTLALLPLDDAHRALIDALVAALRQHGSVLHLTSATLDSAAFAGALDALTRPDDKPLTVTWLNEQESNYRFVVYEADQTVTAWTRQCVLQADRALLLAHSRAESARYPVEQWLVTPTTLTPDLVLVHESAQNGVQHVAKWLKDRRLRWHYNVALDKPETVQRVARHMAGCAVGVVFSSGGVHSLAHVGVARAMQELNIPIDVIGGASLGAIMGSMVAQELPYDEAVRAGKTLFENLVDYTLPLISIASGKRLTAALQRLCGGKLIEDLWGKFFCVSTNVSKATLEVHERGQLWLALRASASMPGIFPPVITQDDSGDVLIDGAVLSDVPFGIMEAMGVGALIIVDVGSEPTVKRSPFNTPPAISGWELLLNRINPFAKRLKAPSMVSTLLRTTMMQENVQRQAARAAADVYIAPQLRGFDMLDSDEAEKIAELGYQAAKPLLAAWLRRHPHFAAKG